MARVYWTAAVVAGVALTTLAGALRFSGSGAAAVQVAALFALAGGLAVCVLVVTRKTQWDAPQEVAPILATAGWESDRAFNSPSGGLIDVDSLPLGPSATSPGTLYRAHGPEDCVLCVGHKCRVASVVAPMSGRCDHDDALAAAELAAEKASKRRAAAQKGLATKAAKRAAREAAKVTA